MTNPRFGKQILYGASTGLEQSLVDVDSARITEINAELIRDIWNPQKCPERLLPYLAWAFGVEYWNTSWSETTKRTWIANQLIFKSMRGTAAAARMAVDFAGRDVSRWGYAVTKITTRPQQVFSGPSLTKAEREAWMQQLPQVRAWRIRDSAPSPLTKGFYGGHGSVRQHSYHFCLPGEGVGKRNEYLNQANLELAHVTFGINEFHSPQDLFASSLSTKALIFGKATPFHMFTATSITLGTLTFDQPLFRIKRILTASSLNLDKLTFGINEFHSPQDLFAQSLTTHLLVFSTPSLPYDLTAISLTTGALEFGFSSENASMREDGGLALREDGGVELRE